MEKQRKKPTAKEISDAIVHGTFKPDPSQLLEISPEDAQPVMDGVKRVQQKFGHPDVEERFHRLDETGQVDFIRDLSLTPFLVSLEVRRGLGRAIGTLWKKIIKEQGVSAELQKLGIGFRQFAVPIKMASRNILMNGAIIAAQSAHEPPYHYHWPRDAALCLRTFTDLAQVSGHPAVERIVDKICDFTEQVQDVTGKWSQRYTLEGDGTRHGANLWADPQIDGIANSMIALSRYVKYVANDKGATLENPRVRKAGVAILRGCGYLLQHTNEPSWGLWEERFGFHQYTTLAIGRAFREFTELYDTLGLDRMEDVAAVMRFSENDSDNRASWGYIKGALKNYTRERKKKDEFPDKIIDAGTEGDVLTTVYRIAKSEIEHFRESTEEYKGASSNEKRELERFIGRQLKGDENYMVSNKNLVKANIPNAPNLGAASVGAVLHFGGIDYDDPYLMSNVMLLDEVFGRIYPMNHKRDVNLWGRYSSDQYDGVWFTGGNPWYICSLWSVQYHYNLAAKYLADGNIDVKDPKQARFLSKIMGEDVSMGVIGRDDERFVRITDALIEEGDKRFENVKEFIPEDGSMSEQIDRNNDQPRGAQHLTWSYDEFLHTIRARAIVGELRKVSSA